MDEEVENRSTFSLVIFPFCTLREAALLYIAVKDTTVDRHGSTQVCVCFAFSWPSFLQYVAEQVYLCHTVKGEERGGKRAVPPLPAPLARPCKDFTNFAVRLPPKGRRSLNLWSADISVKNGDTVIMSIFNPSGLVLWPDIGADLPLQCSLPSGSVLLNADWVLW